MEARAFEAKNLPGEQHGAQDGLPFAASEADGAKFHAAQDHAARHHECAGRDDEKRRHAARAQSDGEGHEDTSELREEGRRARGDVVLRVGLEQHREAAEQA